ncbi:MAG TPA: S24/S26 family peptidase [Alloprevotella sp.]|nr:S24/S26 family peptidase [Alloprevotella sp.]
MRSVLLPNEIFIPEIRKLINEGHTTTFRVRGFSMRLFLEDRRDKVILGPYTSVNVGDVVLAETDKDHYVLHRIIRKQGKLLTLKGDGNVRGTESCTTENIVGIALGFYRKGRNAPDMVTGIKWRLYSKVWLAFTPFRRYLLAFHNRIWLKLFPVTYKE